MVKGNITHMRQVLNEDFSVNCYEVTIDIHEESTLTLGKCEIKQGKKK